MEAVIWGVRKFGFPILENWWQTETVGIMIANYPSMKVKPVLWKTFAWVEIAIAEVNGQLLK
jgi:acetyl-CoA synthetase